MASLDLQQITKADPYFVSHAWVKSALRQIGNILLDLILKPGLILEIEFEENETCKPKVLHLWHEALGNSYKILSNEAKSLMKHSGIAAL